MRNVRFEVSYDGSRFFGWQRQAGFPSVQGALEDAAEALLGTPVSVQGAGRTDTGVHALRQVAHLHLQSRLSDDRLRHALNAHLAAGVVVRRLETCRDSFHSRFDARAKRYLYVVATSRFRPAFCHQHAHWVREPLDLAAMRAAAARLAGTRDFRAFSNTGSPRRTTVRTLAPVRVLARRERFAVIVQGDGFLYNMVRTLVGTLIEVARGKCDPASVTRALESGRRTDAGPTAPAAGLYLMRVLYDEPLFAAGPGPRAGPGFFGRGQPP